MAAPTSIPVGSITVGGVTLHLLRQSEQAHIWYELYVVTPGHWLRVGSYAIFPEAQAAVQAWKTYLEHDGTVQVWLEYNATHSPIPPPPQEI
jgi:hypothetical protein